MNLRAHLLRAADPLLLARDLGMVADDWQVELLRSNRKRVHVNICRQGGKTTTTAIVGLHRALFVPGSLVLIVSPGLRQSVELFRRLTAFYRQLGKPVPPEIENQLSLVLENGSRVIAAPASEGTIRGYSVDLLVIDEAARVPDDTFASVLPMVSVTKGRVVALSTPAGRRGWWYEASKSLRWQHFKLTGDECVRLDPEELSDAREALGDLAYRQEYGCEFVDAAGSAFSGDDVDALFGGSAPPRRTIERRRRDSDDRDLTAAQTRIRSARQRPDLLRLRTQRSCQHRWRQPNREGVSACAWGCGATRGGS